MFLILLGMLWRWYAIATLGRFFTATVMIQPGQRIVTTGPYRFLRHPSYSGVLLIMAGMGCMIGNWGSILFVVSGLLFPLLYRIAVEEQEMLSAFGDEYQK